MDKIELNKVDRDTAIEEINKWFDAIDYEGMRLGKDIPEAMTAEDKAQQMSDKMLLDAVCRGEVVFTEDYELKVHLRTPIKNKDGEVLHSELKFRTYVPLYEYNKAVKGLRGDDADGRMLAAISVFTNVAKSRIDRLPVKSYRILQTIASYLL